MFNQMYLCQGIGLAANQVDLPYRLFVLNLKSDPEAGEEQVFINPVISLPKGSDEAEEGCLSLPGLYAPVRRPASVVIDAFDLDGNPIQGRIEDLLARAVQHETDHLDGILFIDRMSEADRESLADELHELESTFSLQRHRGEIPDDEAIVARLNKLEGLRA
jgi:peptide deformylase